MTSTKATFMSLRTLPALHRRLALSAALALGALVVSPRGADAQVPAPLTMTYQGSLSDAGGRPVDGVRSIAFRLYDAREGGQVVWSEIHAEVDVAQGDFSVVLGEASELPGGVDPTQGLWLGIQVESDDELTPRMRVGGALRAHWAAVAAQALDVRDRHIHPNAVSIGDRPVIDAQGRWVGDPTGLQGPPGEAGATGQPGPAGVPGADGPPGPQGPAGADGAQGPSGPQGDPGSRGPAGEAGRSVELTQDTDADGYEDWMEVAVGTDPADRLSVPPDAEGDGVPDLLQPSGGPGAEGVPGPPGPPGPQGVAGPEGPVGPMGPAGPQGIEGPHGASGAQGPAGPAGPAGPQGPEVDLTRDLDLDGFPDWLEIALGADPVDDADRPADLNNDGVADALVGPQGPEGIEGVQGPAGPAGPQGPIGPQGLVGPAGAQGLQGLPGAQGPAGPAGPAGAQGVAGAPGAQGVAGPQGVQGPAGARGASGLNALLESAVENPGVRCPAGGTRLDFGLDTDANGRLEGAEIAGTRSVCNGVAAAGGGPVTLAAAPPFQCDATHVGATFYDTALGGLRACNGQVWTASGGYCGDAVVQPGEQCDDGNLLSGDGCLAYFCVRGTAADCALACDPTGTVSDTSLRTLKVSAADGAATDNLGFAVSIEGDLVAVGAPNDDGPGVDSGAVFVFSRQADGTWAQPQKLLASDGAASDFFGFSVSISRTHLIVGAWGDDDRGANAGSAYAFTRQPNGTWTETAKLTSADGAAGDFFGYAVGLNGDTAVVGAYGDDDRGADSGSVYIFARQANNTWLQTPKVTSADGVAGDYFGRAVAIDGDSIIAGAYGDDDRGLDGGSVYFLARQGNGNWLQVSKVLAADGAAGDQLGISVALDGGFAVAGAPMDDDHGADSGSAYVFARQANGLWVQSAKMNPPDGQLGDNFGLSVGIAGELVAAGAPGDDDRGADSGSTYTFGHQLSGVWVQRTKSLATDPAAGDALGRGISMSGEVYISGAINNDERASNAGAAYVFDRAPGSALCTTEGHCICRPGYSGDDCSAAP